MFNYAENVLQKHLQTGRTINDFLIVVSGFTDVRNCTSKKCDFLTCLEGLFWTRKSDLGNDFPDVKKSALFLMSGNVVSEHGSGASWNVVSRAPEPGSQTLWEPGPDGLG
jgi:hypothetical protein